jgi:hypothetical protein
MYKELIPFKINGLNTVNVELTGEGTDIKGFNITNINLTNLIINLFNV